MSSDVSIRHRTRLPAEDRRRQIIDAATSVIAQRGFWGLSVLDVADACGLTVNGVLHHVGSKDGLLVAVLDHRDRADVRALAEILGLPFPTDGWSPEDLSTAAGRHGIGLAEICAAVVRRNAGQPEIVRLYSVLEAESMSPDHPAHAYFTDRQSRTLDGFARLAPAGADATALARHLLALMDGLQLQWLRDPAMDLVAAWAQVAAEALPGR
ncbi:MAG TPA: helix-turn-helix domain-containing protein [Cellulomonas sp.]